MRLEIVTRENGGLTEVDTTLLEGPADLVGYGTAASALGLVVVKNIMKYGGLSQVEAVERVAQAFAASMIEMLATEAEERAAQESE